MAQMTPEVSRLLEQALSLSVEEQEALADSLISNLDGKVDKGVQGRSAQTQPSKAASCPLSLRTFMRKPARNTTAAFDWYLARSPEAALKFDAEVERGLGLIVEAPRRWAPGSYATRRFLLKQFPFILIYREYGSVAIQIVAVAHTSRRPGYWKPRL